MAIKQIIINLDGNTTSGVTNEYAQLVPKGKFWTKIGIQAPAGSKFLINKNTFYMGNREVFELDGIEINTFNFEEQHEYVIDEEATKKAKEEYEIYLQACKWWGNNQVESGANYDEALIWANGEVIIYYNKQADGTYDFSLSRKTGWMSDDQINFEGVNGISKMAARASGGIYKEGNAIILKDVIIDYVEEESEGA